MIIQNFDKRGCYRCSIETKENDRTKEETEGSCY